MMKTVKRDCGKTLFLLEGSQRVGEMSLHVFIFTFMLMRAGQLLWSPRKCLKHAADSFHANRLWPITRGGQTDCSPE